MHVGEVIRAPSSFFRLFARWYTLVAIWIVAMLVAIPALFIGDDGFAVLAGERSVGGRDLSAAARQLVLHVGVILPLGFTAWVSTMTQELNSTSISWTLPGLRKRLLAGHVTTMVLMTVLVGVCGARRTDGTTALVAAALVPFWYAIGATWTRFTAAPRYLVSLLLVMLVAVFRPVWYTTVVTTPPYHWASIALGALASMWLLRMHVDTMWSRALVLVGVSRDMVPNAFPFGPLINRAGATLSVVGGTTRRSLLHWVHAALVEHARSLPAAIGARLFGFTIVSLLFYFLNSTVGLMGITFAQQGLQLSGLLMYPLARRQRAHVQFLCCLIEVGVMASVVFITFQLLEALGVARPTFGPTRSNGWRIELALLVAFAPLAQWWRALGPLPQTAFAPRMAAMASVMTPFVVSNVLLLRAFRHIAADVTLAYIICLALLVHAAHFAGLHYVYARRDLRIS